MLSQAAAPAVPRRSPAAKLGLVVVVAVMLVTAHQLGVLDRLSDIASARTWLLSLGALGYLAFVTSYALLQPFGVPGTIFIMVAPLIWPWPVAFGLSMTGTMAASVVGFLFARFVARDWVSQRIPDRFKKYDRALEERGFKTVALLRLLFWMPPMLHAFFGVSKVPFWTHFWGSVVGYLLPLFLVSFFGQELFDFMASLPASAWVAMVAVMIAVGVIWWRRGSRAEAAAEAVEEAEV